MLGAGGYRWTSLLWWLCVCPASGSNRTLDNRERPVCEPGHYCPVGSLTPVPCPRGTYGPTAGATSIDSCLLCPSHHYCPRPGMSTSLPCGAQAQQPLPGQDTCVCLGEKQSFQVSDGQCPCALGYQRTGHGDLCWHSVYDICRNRMTRSHHGTCLDRQQWEEHCSKQVCQSSGDYQGYDGALGLCVCREPPERAACGGWCRSRNTPSLQLECSGAALQLVHSHSNSQVRVSGSVLERVFKHWDSQGTLRCDSQLYSSRPVYTLQSTEAGFVGLLHGVPEEVQRLFSSSTQGKHSLADGESGEGGAGPGVRSSSGVGGVSSSGVGGVSSSFGGVLNPTACLHLGDTLLFTVTTQHYPQYDIEDLYNTNSEYDWGAFRRLGEELSLSWTPPSLFSVVFNQPGVYVLRLSSHRYKNMYIRVMPAGGQCYEAGPFFPTVPRHVTRLGIAPRRHLLLRPDWLVTGGLLLGAVVILSICVTLLILFREYGWPEKRPSRARYRTLQLGYQMDDYSSKGSRVTTVKRSHRNRQARGREDSIQPALCVETTEEFWDYEQQVDLEAFSSNTFYSLLLKHSVSVTARLGQLRGEVKELYQGVLCQLRGLRLRPGWSAVGRGAGGPGCDRLQREVERELARRRSLGQQLRGLLESQLQVLRAELKAQRGVHRAYGARLRESVRLLGREHDDPHRPLWDQRYQHVPQRMALLAAEMAELVTRECRRQGAWAVLGEGTGAKLLCPDTGVVLAKDDIIGPDGSVRGCGAVHTDPVTGLMLPIANSHMVLASGHSMAVPPGFLVHPQTGRVMPVAGNVAYDPASSTLVFTTHACTGEVRKWEFPLLPFVLYPLCRHSNQPVTTRLRGLRPGQRLQLGGAMSDPDTGLLVPILAVTIHPHTGLVYPLGGVHICPLTRLPQPIQLGSPMLDPRTGNVVLTTGVTLDPLTGSVLPVGGVLLGESFIESLSGRLVRVGGASVRAGRLVPHAGGYQALLDSQVLIGRIRLLELLRGLQEDWGSGDMQGLQPPLEHSQAHPDGVRAAAKELDQAWGRSLHYQLQLQCYLESLQDWASWVAQDGGVLGELPIPGSEECVAALLGMEYPDPLGSGLSVPVLGAQVDPLSGHTVPLAGTMEDPEGKGLVAICVGALTVDPVTGVLAPVVGARFDVSTKTVVPITASYWPTLGENPDSVQVEALQREACLRNSYWVQQRQKEEDFLVDLDAALQHCLHTAAQEEDSEQTHRPDIERQLREVAAEQQEAAQCEVQRRAATQTHLALLLPPHILDILTQGDEEEWEQQCSWQTELVTGLDRDRSMRQREFWEQLNSSRSELEVSITALHDVRQLCQVRTDTAQAVLSGCYWYRESGPARSGSPRNPLKMVGLVQQKALPLLERLTQLLEDNKQPVAGTAARMALQSSGLSTKQMFGLETCSRAWTASVPIVKESPSMKETVHPTHICVPTLSEEEWDKLLEVSPLFQLLKGVELRLRGRAREAGLLRGELYGKGSPFIDVLDAQWECEGELIPLDPQTLNAREFLVYQHGLFLLQTLHTLEVTPAVSLQIAASLPTNNYSNNAFRNSFFYQESEETVFVRRQRLQSVGGFSLLLLHCLSHVAVDDLSSDTSPAFQRVFFKALQACLGELFQVRLGGATPCLTVPHSQSQSLLERVQRTSRGLLSHDEVERLLQKHRETSLFFHVEKLLAERITGVTDKEHGKI